MEESRRQSCSPEKSSANVDARPSCKWVQPVGPCQPSNVAPSHTRRACAHCRTSSACATRRPLWRRISPSQLPSPQSRDCPPEVRDGDTCFVPPNPIRTAPHSRAAASSASVNHAPVANHAHLLCNTDSLAGPVFRSVPDALRPAVATTDALAWPLPS